MTESKKKMEILERNGWKLVQPELDLEYLIKLGHEKVFKELGFFLSDLTKHCKENPLALFSKEVEETRLDFLRKITPDEHLRIHKSKKWPSLDASYPSDKDSSDSTISRAFESLQYVAIRNIVKNVLPKPTFVYQKAYGNYFKLEDTSKFDIDNQELLFDKIKCYWAESETYLTLKLESNWGENSFNFSIEHDLSSPHLNSLAEKALTGIGMEINPKSYQVGDIESEFSIDSFPEYIKSYTSELKKDMGLSKDVLLVEDYPNRYNALVVGLPGVGKTRWSQSFAAEVLSPLGYLILVVDYSSIQDIVIPSFINKVCIIINDADTLALNRKFSERGETEQILSWLDGTRSTFIKPFNSGKDSTSVITIMTANTIDDWDEAALRKGRIHSFKTFDGQKLSDI